MNKISISVCIITLGRPSIYKTLTTVFAQSINHDFEVVMILQGEIDLEKVNFINQNDVTVRIYHYDKGLGFAYYRNEAIKKSQGNIITFIDDDQWTKDNTWLYYLTKPILDGKYLVTTAGYQIKMTGKYLTDCISFLGYPGGGSLGYDKLWPVDSNGHTNHICTGNFALSKKVNITFNESLVHGAEDVQFSHLLNQAGISIKYLLEATLYHLPRGGFIPFFNWHIRRGKSVYEYKILGLITRDEISNRKNAVVNIFKNVIFTKYVFGVSFLFIVQYVATLAGYILRSMSSINLFKRHLNRKKRIN